MDARTRVVLLMDMYGALLPETQRDAVRMAYEEDLSLAEIAENNGVSRQAAHWAVRRGVEQLDRFEAAAHGLERVRAWREGVAEALKLEENRIKPALCALMDEMEDRYGI